MSGTSNLSFTLSHCTADLSSCVHYCHKHRNAAMKKTQWQSTALKGDFSSQGSFWLHVLLNVNVSQPLAHSSGRGYNFNRSHTKVSSRSSTGSFNFLSLQIIIIPSTLLLQKTTSSASTRHTNCVSLPYRHRASLLEEFLRNFLEEFMPPWGKQKLSVAIFTEILV